MMNEEQNQDVIDGHINLFESYFNKLAKFNLLASDKKPEPPEHLGVFMARLMESEIWHDLDDEQDKIMHEILQEASE